MDLQRGLHNYQDVLAGRKRVEQLSPVERAEVVQVYRLLRTRSGGEGKSQECREAMQQANDAAEELSSTADRLKACAEQGDVEDDCSSEFSSVGSAHSDYEDAVDAVQGSCN